VRSSSAIRVRSSSRDSNCWVEEMEENSTGVLVCVDRVQTQRPQLLGGGDGGELHRGPHKSRQQGQLTGLKREPAGLNTGPAEGQGGPPGRRAP